jgi:hypothetical protein
LRHAYPRASAGHVALGHDRIEHNQQLKVDRPQIHSHDNAFCNFNLPNSAGNEIVLSNFGRQKADGRT